MSVKINRLKKEEIIYLYNHRCKHHHRYIEIVHPNCCEEFLEKGSPIQEKVGHLDIETTGLNANYDYIISYAIKTEDKTLGRVLTPKEALGWDILDKNLMHDFCKDIRQFDRITVYWGKDRRHDLPFLRSRCIKARAEFPIYKELCMTDVYDICKNKLRLNYYRLENVCKFLGIPAKQHPLDPEIWKKAKLGDKPSLKYIWLHNEEDCVSLQEVYNVMEKYVRISKTSV